MMLTHAQSSIQDFISEFTAGHLTGIEETDLKKNLFSRLYGQFHTLGIRFSAPKSALGIGYYPEVPTVSVNPVKTDYPTAEKFDIVILETDAEIKPANEGDYQQYWQQPLALALHLRTCIDPTFVDRYLKQAAGDLKKFEGFREKTALSAAISLILCTVSLDEIPEGFQSGKPELNAGNVIWLVTPDGFWMK